MARNYAYGHSHFSEDCGVQAGQVASQVVNSGSYKDISVTFPRAFAETPIVVVGFESGSTAGAFGRCCVSVLSRSATGFTLRCFNGDSTNRQPGYTWIASGKMA